MSTSQLFRNTFKPNSTCIFDGHLGFQSISNHYERPCKIRQNPFFIIFVLWKGNVRLSLLHKAKFPFWDKFQFFWDEYVQLSTFSSRKAGVILENWFWYDKVYFFTLYSTLWEKWMIFAQKFILKILYFSVIRDKIVLFTFCLKAKRSLSRIISCFWSIFHVFYSLLEQIISSKGVTL